MRRALLAVLAVGAAVRPSAGQSIDSVSRQPAAPVFSMSQPPRWRPYASASGFMRDASQAGVNAVIGVDRPVLNPATGLVAVDGEIFADRQAHTTAAGLRLLATAPVFGFAVGADWRATTGDIDADMRFTTAIRRGGLLGGGSMLRVDWLPTRGQTLGIGIQVPVAQPFAGRTRRRRTSAELPSMSGAGPRMSSTVLPDRAERALKTVSDAAAIIRAMTNLYSEENEQALASAATLPHGRSYDAA